ncbi:hypothetical protein FB565_000062 [Actinoplanes lutulentus]|uniref:Uncharacterized protein n=1 Tax=Actinoplanes lutulentus TaxID=1287878 RepID=A0A327Z3S0_9ACTN|nr:hypothetical protein [Actinoplanes lutulentus]MBB2940358.1 hypothetical protein [Actinoplanes lutulentus]RAK28851.1 hypothetical protein B0I29_119189 [Actinoplanes lutulentus]
MTEAGIEFKGTFRTPGSLPWSAIESVDRRGAGPLTRLSIKPVGAKPYLVDIGLMTPGPSALLAELRRHHHAPVG